MPKTLQAWLKTRSPLCQALAKEFPHRQRLTVWIIGWGEDENVLLTVHDPAVDYDLAVQEHFEVSATKLRPQKGSKNGLI
jgi:hypothetical protein